MTASPAERFGTFFVLHVIASFVVLWAYVVVALGASFGSDRTFFEWLVAALFFVLSFPLLWLAFPSGGLLVYPALLVNSAIWAILFARVRPRTTLFRSAT